MVPVKLVVVVISIIHVPNSLEFKDFKVRQKAEMQLVYGFTKNMHYSFI